MILIGVPFLVIGKDDSHDTAANAAATRTFETTPAPEKDPQSKLVRVSKGMDSPSAAPTKHTAKARAPKPGHTSASSSASAKHVAATRAATSPKAAPPPAAGKAKSPQSGPKPTTEPPDGPVAKAVKQLAASSPGRHICYRAYVVGIGWQAPVCDGAVAGTVGQSRAIEAIDIAVSGVNGTAANGLMQGSGWQTTSWPSQTDGVDLTIGVPGSSKIMQGFAINVGSGAVCENAHVQNQGWVGQHCDAPGGYIFGGTLDGSLWLEAVQLTV